MLVIILNLVAADGFYSSNKQQSPHNVTSKNIKIKSNNQKPILYQRARNSNKNIIFTYYIVLLQNELMMKHREVYCEYKLVIS